MEQEKGIPITKPKSIWAKPVKLKLKLFTSLFNTFKDAILMNWAKIPSDVLDTISGLELKTGISERGWLLVTRALMDAMLKLVDEHKNRINVESVVAAHLDDQFNEILENQDHYIGFDFFEKPKEMKLLEMIQPVYCEFLQNVGFESPMAHNICNRLAGYFVLALMDEWRKNPDYYQELEKRIKTPLDKAGQKEKEWLHYLAWIKKQAEEPVFAETFSLKQVYIPLRGYYKEKVKGEKKGDEEVFKDTIGTEKYKKIAIELELELTGWLEEADKDDALRIITGGPGYGKSSFLKIFAAKLAETNTRVLFVPLHRFEIKDDLKDALQNFIQYNEYLSHDPLGDERLIIIFDGLDELAMQGKVLADAASHFIREIKMKLMNFNTRQTRVQMIISGRDIIIQANEAEFRKEKQLLHLLPYYIDKEKLKEYTDKKGILIKDQRDAWWINYGKIKGKEYKGLPKELKNEDLDKLTAQPLLNYLVALSFERGKIEFSQSTNLNEIYHDLLEAVHNRSYEESRVHKAVESLDYDLFVRILEEIAVCAWHGDGRTTTAAEIERHCHGSGLDKVLDTFKLSAKEGIVSFMAAFYFRRAGRDTYGEETFEFTHKSFGEFLAAKRIVKKIQQIHKKLLEREKSFDEGWRVKECLTEWIKIFGAKELDGDLLKFFSNEIKTIHENNKDELKAVQNTVIQMMNFMLKSGMPMETIVSSQGSRHPYFTENAQAIKSEKALLIILSTIADFTGEISQIAWPSNTAFGELISRLQGQRTGSENFILNFLNHLNLENAILVMKDFYEANFQETNFQRATILLANLIGANLKGAILMRANLIKADLSRADLSRADLKEADLSRADLKEADLSRADLSGAYLTGADLREANLRGAVLSGADLSGAEVTKKQLEHAIIDEDTKLPWSDEESYRTMEINPLTNH